MDMDTTFFQPANVTAKQWAWEFLRRNHDYRNAWTKLRSLNSAQIHQLSLFFDEDKADFDEGVLGSISLDFFEKEGLMLYEPRYKTVDEYADATRLRRMALNEPGVFDGNFMHPHFLGFFRRHPRHRRVIPTG